MKINDRGCSNKKEKRNDKFSKEKNVKINGIKFKKIKKIFPINYKKVLIKINNLNLNKK